MKMREGNPLNEVRDRVQEGNNPKEVNESIS
jgi:hypothetical protein